MKKLILNSFLATIVFGGVLVAHAETSVNASVNVTASTTRPIDKIKEVRQEAKQDIMDIKAEVKDNVNARVTARIENRYERMLLRFQATIDREMKIMGKINTRIAKIKAAGGNTTEAEKLTAEASVHLDEAESVLAKLRAETEVQSAQGNSSTTIASLRAGLLAMRKTGLELETHLRECHKALLKTVGILRGMSQLNVSATTSTTIH